MKEIYDWVPWFRELAKKIAEGDLENFRNKARKIADNERNSSDPFSFFYFLAAETNREKLAKTHEEYKISTRVPTHVEVDTDRSLSLRSDADDYPSLWDLFVWSQQYNDEAETNNQYFSRILEIENMGVKTLTQCLFLINPNQFIPIDARWYKQQEKDSLERNIKTLGWECYKNALEEVKGIFSGCEFYEIYRACPILHNSDSSSREFFQIGTYAGGRKGSDYWSSDFKPNNWVYTGGPGDQKGWAEDAKDTAKGGPYQINRPKRGDIILVRTGAYQGKAIGIVEENEYAKSEKLDEERTIHVVWINKKEAELIRTLGQPSGFSGAGKIHGTFRDTESYTPTFRLLEMPNIVTDKAQVVENAKNFNKLTTRSEDSYVYQERVFNSFKHWYYFEESDIFAPSKFIGYQNTTVENYRGEGHGSKTETVLKKWFEVLEREPSRYDELSKKLRKYVSSLDRNLKDGYKIHIEKREEGEPSLVDREPENKNMGQQYPLNQILYGPPGTGKTWTTVNHAVAIIERKPVDDYEKDDKYREKIKERFDELKGADRIEMVTFHQNYAYEDFIEGIRPVLPENGEQRDKGDIKYELSEGIFRRIANRAGEKENQEQNYVLIIDEINRGNIAKIFGELITLIEKSKRLGNHDEATIVLPYSKKPFGVPNNLYIIGTMNTADRSIALLDTALRRRFRFVEMMPDPKHSKISQDVQGVNCQELLGKINERIRSLHDRDHQIGHTYFIKVKNMASLAKTFQNQIIPLLQEYFYDNWEKIDLVLNKNGFIKESGVNEGLFKTSEFVDTERKIYELLPANDDKWQDPGSYIDIYLTPKQSSQEGQEN